jgi:transcriptional pleiotropic repressor
MANTILKKMRRINEILHWPSTQKIKFSELCEVLSNILDANVYLLGHRGKLLGFGLKDDYECDVMQQEILKDKRFPSDINRELLNIDETQVINMDSVSGCVFDEDIKCPYIERYTIVIPINGGGDRLGTLVLTRFDSEFHDDDVVLGEHSATVIALEILHAKSKEMEEEAREKAVVQMAVATLSYSELEAMEHIMEELNGNEGLLIASKVADKAGITRSVIVNALRKFESAGIIESRSLGMKGTYIKILNEKLLDELGKYRH